MKLSYIRAIVRTMSTPTPRPHHPDDAEAEFRQAVADGIAQADAGQTIPYEDVRRWILSWGTESELPPPCG
jgi:hypothetical protein